MNYTAHSLFSGIGGLDLGAVYAGFEIKTQIENDPYAVSVLEKHAPKFWNNATVLNDIREVRPEQIGYADLIFGGFPCQDLSYSGQQKGIRGEKSGLFFEAVRLIRDLRPRAVLLENVLGIERNGLREVLHTLSKSGYSATWTYVRASQLGATQRRERWFCVAIPEQQHERYSMGYASSSRLKSGGGSVLLRKNPCKTSNKLAL